VAPSFKPAYLIHGDDHGRIAERRARLKEIAESQGGGAQGVELLEGETGTQESLGLHRNDGHFLETRQHIFIILPLSPGHFVQNVGDFHMKAMQVIECQISGSEFPGAHTHFEQVFHQPEVDLVLTLQALGRDLSEQGELVYVLALAAIERCWR